MEKHRDRKITTFLELIITPNSFGTVFEHFCYAARHYRVVRVPQKYEV